MIKRIDPILFFQGTVAPQTISSDNTMVPGYMAATPTSPGMPYKAATPYQYPYTNTTQPQGFTQVNNTLKRTKITQENQTKANGDILEYWKAKNSDTNNIILFQFSCLAQLTS